MKKVQRSVLLKINRLIASLLSLIGVMTFDSCAYGCPIDLPVAYGTPTADFYVNGRVENRLSEGIAGIEVRIDDTNELYGVTTTQDDGSFTIRAGSTFPVDEFYLVATDVDSTENGLYKTDSVLVRPKYIKNPNNSWNQVGHTGPIIITLEEETNEQE